MANAPRRLEILAPLSGVLVPLDSVPDPVFAQKMVGDGVSLDPTSALVLAPMPGKVVQLHDAHHALTISGGGVDLLIHVGIDTVQLRGAGFTPLVAKGDSVAAGQPLLSFDADLVAGRSKSLLTQIVVANMEGVSSVSAARGSAAGGLVEAGRDVVLTIELPARAEAGAEPDAAGREAVFSRPVAIPNAAGLHARPAAMLAAEAKRYSADVRLLRGTDEVNAKSVVAILGLSLKKGDEVRLRATGADASIALAALEELVAQGCGENPDDVPGEAPLEPAAPAAPGRGHKVRAEGEYEGVAASPGLAVGRVLQYRQGEFIVPEEGEGAVKELDKLENALRAARIQVDDLRRQSGDSPRAQILAAHHELLDDPDLTGLATAGLEGGKSAAFAWREAFACYAARLEALDNPLLRERAGDIRDVGRRVLGLLAGAAPGPVVTQAETILIAHELSPSDTAALDRTKVLGFCTATGGGTSHVAILARSLGIPAICGIDEEALNLPDGTLVVLDGAAGVLKRDPGEAELAQARARMAEQSARREAELAAAGDDARTADGQRIEVAANVRNGKEAREAAEAGGEGVGLLRSEFLFDKRDSAPDEEEQFNAYAEVAKAFGPGRRVVIRTLDVGGDKPLSYIPLPREDNPFLGIRGVRVSLERPDLFRVQLRAILRTAPLCGLNVMFPMIAGVDELREARAYLDEERAALGINAPVKVGVMIEVPSAAVLAEVLAPEADFFSIGSNDLTQYTLAMDRGHPRLAKQADALHPAVLRLVGMAAGAAKRHGKWTGVCGGVASDVAAVPVLIGLGVEELSVSVPAIPAVKAAVARFTLAQCRELAQEVLKLSTATEVRARLARLAQ
ncbi:MAG: phosphoenolpyruvate--protein phosphotransferase [Desulfovibrio sp.]|jgi:phosphocarrier protein FPr/phosphocarrier protein|nr:phosphoenolpyruvate--protein phosphotransferase [Desulfovibrio sp.]